MPQLQRNSVPHPSPSPTYPEIQPPTASVAIDCLSEDTVVVTIHNPNETDVHVGIWIDINDNNARDDSDLEVEGFYGPGDTAVPFALPIGFHGRLIVVTEDRTHILDTTLNIICDYPVPTQFNAEPEPPSCDTAGSFDTDFLGEPGEDGWYEFENVFVSVDRSVEGEVTLTLIAKDGFVLTGLDTEKWSVSEGGTSAERTIVLAEQLSGPEACPLRSSPCPRRRRSSMRAARRTMGSSSRRLPSSSPTTWSTTSRPR